LNAAGNAKNLKNIVQILVCNGFIQRDLQGVFFVEKVDARCYCFGANIGEFGFSKLKTKRIKEMSVGLFKPGSVECSSQCLSHVVRPLRDAADSHRAVIHRIHSRHVCEQGLRSADVGSRLFATDMLFASLQGHAQGTVAVFVHRNADNPTRNLPLEIFCAGKKSSVWAAIAEWHPKTLGVAYRYVSPPFSGRRQQSQGEQI